MPHFLFLYPSEHNGDGGLLVWRPDRSLKWWQHAVTHLHRSPAGMETRDVPEVVATCYRTPVQIPFWYGGQTEAGRGGSMPPYTCDQLVFTLLLYWPYIIHHFSVCTCERQHTNTEATKEVVFQ